MNIVVTGSRLWTDELTIRTWLRYIARAETGACEGRLAHGDCRGADKIAARIGCELGFDVHAYPPDWNPGPAGGPIRNRKMIETEMPRRLIAFALTKSGKLAGGTLDCIEAALSNRIPVIVVPQGGRP